MYMKARNSNRGTKDIALCVLCFTVSACQNSEYDAKFLDLLESGKQGNFQSAVAAYDYCSAFLKLDPVVLKEAYVGKCASVQALIKDIALEKGDPAEIKTAYTMISNDMRLSGQNSTKHENLPDYYWTIAEVQISKLCKSDRASASCFDKEVTGYFGLSFGK